MSADQLVVKMTVVSCSAVQHEDGQSFVRFTVSKTVKETHNGVKLLNKPSTHRHWSVNKPYVKGQVVNVSFWMCL